MKHIALTLLLAVSILQVDGQSKSAGLSPGRHLNIENAIALDGYDPVAYFTQGKALEGEKHLQVSWGGAFYYFSSLINKNLFVKNPAKYLPMYGGWCAYAMGESGEKVKVDPETFKMVEGKLYLFYNFRFNNTLKSWNKDESRLKGRADANWNRIVIN